MALTNSKGTTLTSDQFDEEYKKILDIITSEAVFLNKTKTVTRSQRKNKKKLILDFFLYIKKMRLLELLFFIISIIFVTSILLLLFIFGGDYILLNHYTSFCFRIYVAVILMITWIETINLTLQDLKNPEYQVERSLEKTKYEGLNDRIISVKLSVFSLQSLEYTEKRLRLLIESKEIDYKRAIDVLAPCFGIFIGALIVWQYNTVNNTPNAINAILANLIVISGIITILLKAYITYLDKPTLYKRGLHIVEYAKIIKDNNEQSPINNSNKIKNYQNVMDVLIHGPKIDVDPDFDHNS